MLLYKQRGGGWFGHNFFTSYKGTWPLVTLEFYDDKIILKGIPKQYAEISLDKITFIKKLTYIPLFVWGIKITHQDETAPPFLFFWGFSLDKILRLFKKYNIPIK